MAEHDQAKKKGGKHAPPVSGVLPRYRGTPLSDLPVKRAGPRRSSSSRFNEKSRARLERLPAFSEVPENKRQDLFVQKIRQCCVVFDFTNPISDAEGKELKREILKELVEFITTHKHEPFSEPTYTELFNMIAVNLFRPLPPRVNPSGPAYDPEEDEPILEEAWPHLRIVYKFFLHFLESPALKTSSAQAALSEWWIRQLIALFDSEDPRERDYLKTTLHRIYGRFLEYRAFIRQEICYIFYQFIYETERHNGTAELLEILGTIIHGFALPLKDEHKLFLEQGLLPLHKVRCAGLYYPQLAYCIYQFLEKDPSLTTMIFSSILRFWPAVNSPKEMMFLSEIEELLSIAKGSQLKPIIAPLFRRLARCMSSLHFQVAEKALCFWRKKAFMRITRQYLPSILPIVYGPLYTNSKNHWHRSVRVMSLNALRLFMEMDSQLFTYCTEQYRIDFVKNREARKQRAERWSRLLGEQPGKDQSSTELEYDEEDTQIRPGGESAGSAAQKPKSHTEDDSISSTQRKKSLLPVDAIMLEALHKHVGLDEGDSDGEGQGETEEGEDDDPNDEDGSGEEDSERSDQSEEDSD